MGRSEARAPPRRPALCPLAQSQRASGGQAGLCSAAGAALPSHCTPAPGSSREGVGGGFQGSARGCRDTLAPTAPGAHPSVLAPRHREWRQAAGPGRCRGPGTSCSPSAPPAAACSCRTASGPAGPSSGTLRGTEGPEQLHAQDGQASAGWGWHQGCEDRGNAAPYSDLTSTDPFPRPTGCTSSRGRNLLQELPALCRLLVQAALLPACHAQAPQPAGGGLRHGVKAGHPGSCAPRWVPGSECDPWLWARREPHFLQWPGCGQGQAAPPAREDEPRWGQHGAPAVPSPSPKPGEPENSASCLRDGP